MASIAFDLLLALAMRASFAFTVLDMILFADKGACITLDMIGNSLKEHLQMRTGHF